MLSSVTSLGNFYKVLEIYFLMKVAQMFCNFLGHLEKFKFLKLKLLYLHFEQFLKHLVTLYLPSHHST